ncbi:DUF4430 domain-containing protein [Paraliobacillus sp. JSM ZJ581]|uniref:DUF4430 domain-containing protein n=1 Tax=Paraliobacillus sp. JSM ZJ581 TaxID=3342118 RepID=UPI0035A82641
MKKITKFFLLLLLSVFIVGCGPNEQTNKANENVTITISENKQQEIISEKVIQLKEETNLLTILKENFTIVEEDGFITSIEGKKQDASENRYWMYTVNDEHANVGAGEYDLSPDDKVNFDLQEVSY